MGTTIQPLFCEGVHGLCILLFSALRNERMHHTQPFKFVKMYPKLIAKGVFQINFGEAQSMGFNWRVKTTTQKCYILVKNGKSC
jgi:hypothetical protein